MKKIFTFLTSVLFLSSAFAFSNRLTVSSSNDNADIRVQVDGRYVQQGRNNNNDEIAIDDLRAGYHSIKVYSSGKKRNGWGNNNNNNNMQLLYSGNVYVRNGYHTDIVINRFGKAFVDEQLIDNYNNGNNNNNNNNWNRQPMNEHSFEQLKQTVRRESFDENKMSVLKNAVRDNWVSTAQAIELIKLFSFEDNKLNIAKYCYHYTTDYNNYYSVANLFSFSKNKQELMRYIEQNRRQ